jgi:dsDNA-specific endonuclease/ATPase MutS2
VIIGIRKLKGQQSEPVKAVYKQGLPDPYGLDAGIPCTELTDDDLIRRLKDKEEEVNDMNEQYEKMRLEHEELKERFEETIKALKEIRRGYPDLKLAYEQVKEETEKEANKKVFYYKKWYATLTDEEKKEEENRQYNERIVESVHRGKCATDWVEKYEEIEKKLKTPQPAPAKVKSVLQMIDGSDSEDDDEGKTVRLKDNKILKALGCDVSDCDFIE